MNAPVRVHPAPAPDGRRLPWLGLAGVGFALLVLVGVVETASHRLREELRRQLAGRDARILAASLRQQLEHDDAVDLTDPLAALVDAVLLPDFPGIRAVRVYDPAGRFTAALVGPTQPVEIPPDARQALLAGRVFSHLRTGPDPVLEVTIPLFQRDAASVAGGAVFELEGGGLLEEFAALDANLRRQTRLTVWVAGSALAAVLGLAFWRLHTANRRLAEESSRLARANAELTLAAKTSAVGAVASHLVHGLKNPLIALQQFVATQGPTSPGDDAGWADAATTARRMKTMIDDVVRVLRDEQHLTAFEVPWEDLADALRRRLEPLARERGIVLETRGHTATPLANRDANLVLLILENLVTNACQACPPGARVGVEAREEKDLPVIAVRDTGPGIPEHLRAGLFTPSLTSKPGGTGLGLALSRQLARHLGADLVLLETGPHGTTFQLRLPPAELAKPAAAPLPAARGAVD